MHRLKMDCESEIVEWPHEQEEPREPTNQVDRRLKGTTGPNWVDVERDRDGIFGGDLYPSQGFLLIFAIRIPF